MKKILLFALSLSLMNAADFVWTGIDYSTGGGIVQNEPQPGTGNQLQAGQYQVDNHNRVWFRGTITCTFGGINGNTTLFILPTGFRPKNYTIVPAEDDNGGVIGLQINPTGEVVTRNVLFCTPFVDFISLEGVNFSIAN